MAKSDETPVRIEEPKSCNVSEAEAQKIRTRNNRLREDTGSGYHVGPRNLQGDKVLLRENLKQPDCFFCLPNFAGQNFARPNHNLRWKDRLFFYVDVKKFTPKNACAAAHNLVSANEPKIMHKYRRHTQRNG